MNNEMKKSKFPSADFVIFLVIIGIIAISYITGYINRKKIENKLRVVITDKSSEFTYKDSFKCSKCVSSCDGSCIDSKTIDGCKVYHFDVKDSEVSYDMYYISRNESYSYQDNREIKLDYKIIKNLFESKYSDYEINVNLRSDFSLREFKFSKGLNVELSKFADLSDSLTKELYNDIFSIINKVDYVLLSVSDDLKLHFEKDRTITLTGSGYYKLTTYDKTYDEVIKSIEKYRRK